MFLPALTGKVLPNGEHLTTSGNCFGEIDFLLTQNVQDPTEFQLVVTLGKPRSLTCTDFFVFGNVELNHHELFVTRGTHKVNFKTNSASALVDIQANGLETFLFCEYAQDEILSVWTTLKAFVPALNRGKETDEDLPLAMIEANVEFLKWGVNWELEKRPIKNPVFDVSVVQSGDYFAQTMLEGSSAMMMYGTGSRSSHSLMALEMEG